MEDRHLICDYNMNQLLRRLCSNIRDGALSRNDFSKDWPGNCLVENRTKECVTCDMQRLVQHELPVVRGPALGKHWLCLLFCSSGTERTGRAWKQVPKLNWRCIFCSFLITEKGLTEGAQRVGGKLQKRRLCQRETWRAAGAQGSLVALKWHG